VFTPISGDTTSIRLELDSLRTGKAAITKRSSDIRLPSHPLATYQGYPSDIDKVLVVLPIRDGDQYSPYFNNCQHFAATFLIFLEAFALENPEGSFRITEVSRMSQVLSVLNQDGPKRSNKANIYMVSSAPVAGIATAGALAAAEATVVSTAPAAGVLGWFGVTTTVVAPAAYAGLAAAIAPFTAVATVAAGAALLYQCNTWKGKTEFNDPRDSGFPSQSSVDHDREM